MSEITLATSLFYVNLRLTLEDFTTADEAVNQSVAQHQYY